MKTEVFVKGMLIFLIILTSSFIVLYLILEPIVQSTYQKGYERGNIACEQEYDEPIMNPFGEFEITFNESPNWTMDKCCYPADCLPEALDNPEDCPCTYPIYCTYYYNLS